MRGHEFGGTERNTAGPSPAGMVHVVDQGRSEFVQSAQLIKGSKLLVNRVRKFILRQKFADGSLLSFSARPVVSPDVEDDRILPETENVQSVDQLSNLGIGVFGEPGEDFHQSALERLLCFRNAVP